MPLRTILTRVALTATFLLTTLTLPACKTPEERAMDQMDSMMRTNTQMMKHMQKSMEEADRDLQRGD
jgi:hypothetical protein